MSEEFEVPAAHEHQVHHEAHHGVGLSQQVAIFTAVLATLGAIISYQGGHTQNEALYYKNDAVLNRTLAADQWAYYQSKSIKEQLVAAQAESADAAHAPALREKAERYAQEKEQIRRRAESLDEAAESANIKAEHALHPHEKLAQAMTFIQIAISAASITALTRRRWLFGLAGLSAVAGLVFWTLAFLG
jgi:serine phosphatase RsbU (regulator of sigma subunit)